MGMFCQTFAASCVIHTFLHATEAANTIRIAFLHEAPDMFCMQLKAHSKAIIYS